jgi:hypothetical protein
MFSVDDRNGSFDVMAMQPDKEGVASPQVEPMMDDKERRLTMNSGVSDDPVLEGSDDEYWNDEFSLKNPYDEDEVAPYTPPVIYPTNPKVSADESRIANPEESDVYSNDVIPSPPYRHSSFLDIPAYQGNTMMKDYPINQANYLLDKASSPSMDHRNDTNFMDPSMFTPQPFAYMSYESPSSERNLSQSNNPVHEYPLLSHIGTSTTDEGDLDTLLLRKKRARLSVLSEKDIIAKREAQLQKNRDFAKLSRDRKKMYLQTLQLKITALSSEYSDLAKERDALIASTRQMQEKLAKLQCPHCK